jgi:MRG-binding protein
VDENEDEGEEETEVADDDEEADEEDGTPSPKTSKGNKAAKVQNPSRKSKRKR